jgi:hypothetical protein
MFTFAHCVVQKLPRDSFYIRLHSLSMGEMNRANVREEEDWCRYRFASTLVISASIIAEVRLARDDISRLSPRLSSVIADSLALARMILDRVVR